MSQNDLHSQIRKKMVLLRSNVNFVKPCVCLTLHVAVCLCDVYVMFLICVMFVQFHCIIVHTCLCNNMESMQGLNENQFQLFGLTLGK